jgi:hypothetical protein
MSVPQTERPTPDPAEVRKAARRLLRVAGYEPGTVMYFSAYANKLRVHVVTADAGVVKHIHHLPGGSQDWTEF